MKKLALHWQILIGMAAGVLFGILMQNVDFGSSFIKNWISPVGTIFIRLLKLIAVPLIIASLLKGISDLKDISKFSQIGGRTIMLYMTSTVVAISIGLLIVNIIQPGTSISKETLEILTADYGTAAQQKLDVAHSTQAQGPLQFVVDMVPDNILSASSDNKRMLEVIFFIVFFGISMLLVEEKSRLPVKAFFDSLNDIILKMVDLIMIMAPFAVFALLAGLVVETTNGDIFVALGWYTFSVALGLTCMLGLYILVVSLYCKKTPSFFLKGISPAQLLAFSTSSSAATLPVTMERVEEHLGVEKEVSSFVCPVGATINMDGTSLYQAVAAVFICQAIGYELDFGAQLTIILTATLASIGSAAVPGAGMVMLVIVLEAVGLPAEYLGLGIALIFAVDRPLDMLRTTINVSGDATVAMVVAKSLGKLTKPKIKNWDDNLENV